MTAHQFGYTNVIATLGTALTERHIQLLRRVTQRAVLAMDADAAGIEAALRGEEVARSAASEGERTEAVVAWDSLVRLQARAPVDVRVFTVPSGKDPDEAIREDPQGWPDWVRDALPPFEFRWRLETSRTDMASPRARLELADKMLPLLLQIGDPALQAAYLSKVAVQAGVPETTLATRLRSRVSGKDRGERMAIREPASAASATAAAPPRPGDRTEAFVLALLLRHSALREIGTALSPGLFQQTVHRHVFARWLEHEDLENDGDTGLVPGVVQALIAGDLPPYSASEAEAALIGAVQKLRLRSLSEEKRMKNAEIAELQVEVDQSAAIDVALRIKRRGDDGDLEGEPESVLMLASHLRDDDYLTREMHALEWEKRTGRPPKWAGGELENLTERPV
jgi:DNA primase